MIMPCHMRRAPTHRAYESDDAHVHVCVCVCVWRGGGGRGPGTAPGWCLRRRAASRSCAREARWCWWGWGHRSWCGLSRQLSAVLGWLAGWLPAELVCLLAARCLFASWDFESRGTRSGLLPCRRRRRRRRPRILAGCGPRCCFLKPARRVRCDAAGHHAHHRKGKVGGGQGRAG
jgi:hypothetical protein